MDVRQTIIYNNCLRLTLLLLCVYVWSGSLIQHNNLREKPDALNHDILAEDSTWLHHDRVRRRISGYCGSERQCAGNETVFTNDNQNNCNCDHACFKIFKDCCPDYERACGRQESLETESASIWKCVDLGWSPVFPCLISGVVGVWMIYKCPENWPLGELRTRCEKAPSEFSYPVEDFVPVVGTNSITYRNKHCALCNGVENYTSWYIGVRTYVIPPEGFDLDSRLQFIENTGGKIEQVSLRGEQPRRFCFGQNYIENCSSVNNRAYKDCINGPVEVATYVPLLSEKYRYFKNYACAACNGYRGLTGWKTAEVCSPVLPQGFSLVFNLRNTDEEPTTTVVTVNCPSGTVYDTSLKFCREGYIISSSGKLTNEFLILLWFKKPRGDVEMNKTLEKDFKTALVLQFSLVSNQVSNIVFHKQDDSIDLIVATFRLTLTPFQSLIMANQRQPNINITRENVALLKVLNSTGNFTLIWRNCSFPVIKVISKRLSCYEEVKFQSNEYKLDTENGKLVEIKTGKIFLLEDYSLVKEGGGNVTLCRKLVLSDCTNGSFVPLRPDEYVIFPNLSVYQNATGSIFNFGEYLIDESLKNGNNHPNLYARNSTISVCLPFKNTFNKTETRQSLKMTSYALRLLTLIGFSISIACLLLLLITYGLFQELRTLPGMNLMNLSFSMLLSHSIWLISANFTETTACKALAILEHYSTLVSFLIMSVISHHSCRAFSQPLTRRNTNKPWKQFFKYSVFAWLVPAVYIAVCVTLDETEAFLVDYGRNCFLGTANAKLYLFFLPIAIILLYNIYTFIKTAVSLYRHEKQRKTLQRQEGKQNLLICTKLATLVGFPWLFSFFGILFPDVEAFEYLFVVFVCLQGLYIGVAFLLNKKTLNLYKDRLNIGFEGNTSSTTPTFGMTVR